jgi:mono/diheme cytochrome c family protein
MLNLPKLSTVMPRWCLAAVVASLLTGCDFPGRPNPADRPLPADQVVDFNHLFQTNCAGCHGTQGMQGPAPPLNDAIFLSIVPDAELLGVITDGRAGTPMAPFASQRGGTLNEMQVKALATGLKARWTSPVGIKAPLPPYLIAKRDSANNTRESLERGATSFARACAVCHGKNGQGTTRAGAIHDPAFLGLISDQALRRIIITGRPDLGMPNFADNKARGSDYQPLSSSEIDDLVALLGVWRQSVPPFARLAKSASTSRLSTDTKEQKP